MTRIAINEIEIDYDLIGHGEDTIVITPGGRFSKDAKGIRPFAEALAAAGKRVLIWDRPNTGASDISFAGASESIQNADTLAALIKVLGLGPAYLIGGSGGARDSLLTAIRHPDIVKRLFVLWISGGAIGLTSTCYFYYHDSAAAAALGGMEAVAALPAWKEQIERNPRNRDILLGQNVDAFLATMRDWAEAFFPQPGAPLPGVSVAQLAAIDLPVMVLRSGKSDIHHPRATSEALHALIPGAQITDPPWADREWIESLMGQATGRGLFENWPRLAEPALLFSAK